MHADYMTLLYLARGQIFSHKIWAWREFWYEFGGRLWWEFGHLYFGIFSHLNLRLEGVLVWAWREVIMSFRHNFSTNSYLILRWPKIPWKNSFRIRHKKVVILECGFSLTKNLPSEHCSMTSSIQGVGWWVGEKEMLDLRYFWQYYLNDN
jgi:hypothetical protein